MQLAGFTAADFNVFKIEGLEPRMEAIKERIQPKLIALGSHFSGELSILTGNEMYPHVAKHLRRTINPPKDTWVAFAGNNRGYKMLPHFQIGLWETHVFIWFAVIYEASNKEQFGEILQEHVAEIKNSIPDEFVWSIDHTKPDGILHRDLTEEDLTEMFQRLQNVKKAELLCGIHIPREEAVMLSDEEFVKTAADAFVKLIPLYKLY
ncbi:DUF1054 domain-containing protein [Peribacillus saganii]|uniref:UPF0637 protein D0469_04070 n=1 Tax=Peribacillus saganii TaxID=2303992 RepID=A0A372LSG6_9BACI|nr:DUF1054 domain-containing protein [Peribacillus saganii]RFU71123.1 DUF1054 domain-containing protein [Peribacillus saganii]